MIYLSDISPLNSVIVRFSGEIPIKSESVRYLWERTIYRRVRRRIRDVGEIERRRGYIFIRTNKPYDVINLLKPVFGINSLIPARRCRGDLEEIKEAALLVAKHYYKIMIRRGIEPRSFAIVSRKVIGRDFGTTEVRYDVGKYVKETLGLNVNLDNPDIPIYIEVRGNEAFTYAEVYRAAGGLPIGVQERIVMLAKPDYESITTIWLLMKRGCPVTAVHFTMCDDQSVDKLSEILNDIFNKSCENMCRLQIISLKDELKEIMSIVPKEYSWYILLKYMVNIAEDIAREEKAKGIAIGLRGILDKEMLSLVGWLKSVRITLHYPVLNYTDKELMSILDKIKKLLDVDVSGLSVECPVLRELKKTRATINIPVLNRYWVNLINKL